MAYEVEFGRLLEIFDDYDSVVASVEASDDSPYDEIRIACAYDGNWDRYCGNYVCHSRSGGFVYAGQGMADEAESDDPETTLEIVLANATGQDVGEVSGTYFNVNGVGYCDGISTAELSYGSEAWNAFDRTELL